MGVKGLTSYVIENAANFREFQLHNTWVVIDALNFLNYLYIDCGLETQFNGENVDFQVAIVKVIRVFQQCLIRPVFIFDGCHINAKLPTQLKRARDRLQTSRSVAQAILTHPNQNHCSLRAPILPPLVPMVLAQTLTELRIPFVVSDRESDEDAVGLAIHLKCPVISNDSDFFITIPSDVPGTCFLPLHFLCWTPKHRSQPCPDCTLSTPSHAQCHYLSCQQFLLSGPAFSRLPPAQRPLFATLIGNDYVPGHRFASVLPCSEGLKTPLNSNATKAMRRNRRHTLYSTVMDWLAGFGSNLSQPTDRLLNRIPKEKRSAAQKELYQSLLSYEVSSDYIQTALVPFLELDVTENISRSIILDEKTDDVKLEFAASTDCSSEEDDDDQGSEDESDGPVQNEDVSLHSVTTPDSALCVSRYLRITRTWPEGLVCQFRQHRILPVYLDALYSGGSVLNCGIEALRDCPSIHACTDVVRQHIYSLLLGYEKQHAPIGISRAHLSGLMGDNEQSWFVKEYMRKGSFQIRPHRMSVQPMQLDLSDSPTDRRLAFLQSIFTDKFNPNESHTAWLHALALLSCIWFEHGALTGSNLLSTCPYLMTFASLAITSYVKQNRTQHVSPMRLEKLKRVKHGLIDSARYFLSLNPVENESTGSLHLYTVHVFGQLQSLYAALYSLGAMLDGLCAAHELDRCIPLPDVCTLFPSGRLYHTLAQYLRLSPSEDRISLIQHKVFPRLLGSHDARILHQAHCYLNEFMRLVMVFQGSYVGSHLMHTNHNLVKGQRPQHGTRPERGTPPACQQTKRKHRKKRQSRDMSTKELDAKVERIMLENGLTD